MPSDPFRSLDSGRHLQHSVMIRLLLLYGTGKDYSDVVKKIPWSLGTFICFVYCTSLADVSLCYKRVLVYGIQSYHYYALLALIATNARVADNSLRLKR